VLQILVTEKFLRTFLFTARQHTFLYQPFRNFFGGKSLLVRFRNNNDDNLRQTSLIHDTCHKQVARTDLYLRKYKCEYTSCCTFVNKEVAERAGFFSRHQKRWARAGLFP